MSEYKGIKGFQVQTRTSDPVPYAQALADNPYAGTWAAGGALNTGRESFASSGTLTSGQAAAGYASPGVTNAVENYNGTSWTEVAEVNTTRRQAKGAGTANTSTIIFGGTTTGGVAPSASTETWNGSSWSAVNDLNTGRSSGVSSQYGSTTAALLATGRGSPGSPPSDSTGFTNFVESWNGSSWTEVTETGTSRRLALGSGTSTSMLVASGQISPNNTANVESWNGSAWTEIAEVNTSRNSGGSAGVSNSSNLIFGGYSGGAVAVTEDWNGSAWTEVNDLSTSEYDHDGAGTSSAAWSAGGNGYESRTEEWSFSGLDPSTTPAADYADAITGDFYYNSTTGQFKNVGAGVGAWASGGSTNDQYAYQGSCGTQTAGFSISGLIPPGYDAYTEQYDGTSWTETANVNGARHEASAFGSTTAAIFAAGYGPNSLTPTERTDKTESFDGSSWTEVAETNEIKNIMGSGGTATAGIIYGGAVHPNPAPTATANVEYWNGSGWSEQTNMNQARSYLAGFGTQTSITAAGGNIGTAGTTPTNVVETWDGTSWTEVTEINNQRTQYSSGGTTGTSGLIFAGYQPPNPGVKATTEEWDGSSWTEVGDLATARRTAGRGPVGSSTSSMIFGGQNSVYTATEEWTVLDFQIKTVTTS